VAQLVIQKCQAGHFGPVRSVLVEPEPAGIEEEDEEPDEWQ
jgi:hypothetical protein